jgi:hypothetical protein
MRCLMKVPLVLHGWACSGRWGSGSSRQRIERCGRPKNSLVDGSWSSGRGVCFLWWSWVRDCGGSEPVRSPLPQPRE